MDDIETPKTRLREQTADELKTALDASAARAQERARTRLTAEDVLERRAAKPRKQRRMRASTGAGVVLLLAAGITLGISSGISTSASAEQAHHQADIEKLTAQVDALEAELGESSQEAPEAGAGGLSGMLQAARASAEQVAQLQNQYAVIAANNAEPGLVEEVAHRSVLAPFFASGTYLLDDQQLGEQTTAFGLDATQIDPRLSWFDRTPGTGAASWGVVSATPEANNVSSLATVTWLYQDDTTGDLLAWAKGTWSADIEQFISLSVGTTALGDRENAATQTLDGISEGVEG